MPPCLRGIYLDREGEWQAEETMEVRPVPSYPAILVIGPGISGSILISIGGSNGPDCTLHIRSKNKNLPDGS